MKHLCGDCKHAVMTGDLSMRACLLNPPTVFATPNGITSAYPSVRADSQACSWFGEVTSETDDNVAESVRV